LSSYHEVTMEKYQKWLKNYFLGIKEFRFFNSLSEKVIDIYLSTVTRKFIVLLTNNVQFQYSQTLGMVNVR